MYRKSTKILIAAAFCFIAEGLSAGYLVNGNAEMVRNTAGDYCGSFSDHAEPRLYR